jgi:hypothetical protein
MEEHLKFSSTSKAGKLPYELYRVKRNQRKKKREKKGEKENLNCY